MKQIVAVAAVVLGFAPAAAAQVIDFENYAVGTVFQERLPDVTFGAIGTVESENGNKFLRLQPDRSGRPGLRLTTEEVREDENTKRLGLILGFDVFTPVKTKMTVAVNPSRPEISYLPVGVWTRFDYPAFPFEPNGFARYFTFSASPDLRIDNLTYIDRVTTVPEPLTWAMMIFGFSAIGAVSRRKQPRTATPTA